MIRVQIIEWDGQIKEYLDSLGLPERKLYIKVL